MFSSISTLNSFGRNNSNTTGASNYWQTSDSVPYVYLHPQSTSIINTSQIDNQVVYIGGSFSRIFPLNARFHSIYDINSSVFKITSKNYGTNGTVYAYAYDSSNNLLYCGGNFTQVTDNDQNITNVKNVAVWNISTKKWFPFGNSGGNNGTNGTCTAMALDASNNVVYVGGGFTTTSSRNGTDTSYNYVAAWNVNTQLWSRLGGSATYNGMDASCNALVYGNNKIYAGGFFRNVYDTVNIDLCSNYVAAFNISSNTWSLLGNTSVKNNGVNAACRALYYESSNNMLYAGGDFTIARDSRLFDISVNYAGQWNVKNSQWAGLGNYSRNGTNGTINSYAYDSSNNIVYCGGSFSQVYDSSNIILNANNAAIYNLNTSAWSVFGDNSMNGVNGICNVIAYDGSNSSVYVGGNFTSVRDNVVNTDFSVNYIARWDAKKTKWNPVGGGFNGVDYGSTGTQIIYSSVYDSCKNVVYVAGSFSYLYDTSNVVLTANNIACWNINGGYWTRLGSAAYNGTNANVLGLAMDSSNQILYTQGLFTRVRDASNLDFSANSIAAWNATTSSWSRFGPNGTSTGNGYTTTVSTTYNTLIYDSSNSALYVGVWLSTSLFYDSTGTKTIYGVAVWNIKTQLWEWLGAQTSGNGLNNATTSMAMDMSNQTLYIASNANNTRYVINVNGNNNALAYNNIVRYDLRTKSWSVLGSTTYNGTNGIAYSMAVDSSNSYLYAHTSGTTYLVYDATNTAGLTVNNIAKFNIKTQTWAYMGTSAANGITGTSGNGIFSMLVDSSNSLVYVGGQYTTTKDATNTTQTVNRVASYSLTTNTWSTLGSSTNPGVTYKTGGYSSPTVNSIVFDGSKNLILSGGWSLIYNSTTNEKIYANSAAYYNVSTKVWSLFGSGGSNGTNNQVSTMILDTSYQKLYVGGFFKTVSDSSNIDLSSNYISSWNLATQRWVQLGNTNANNGLDGSCNALALDSVNNIVYVGGNFVNTWDASYGDQSLNYIAKWNANYSVWQSLGGSTIATNGTQGTVTALDYDSTNGQLFVGGKFTKVRDGRSVDISVNYIANWSVSKSQWSGMGGYASNGTNGIVYSYAYDSCKNVVYCGGRFTQVYDSSNVQLAANNIASWNVGGKYWAALGSGANNGTDASVNAMAMDSSNQILYVGGNFKNVWDGTFGDQSANFIAKWNAGSQTWSLLGGSTTATNGTTNSINTLIYDSSNSALYVGGNFKIARDSRGDLTTNSIASWDTINNLWYRFGSSSQTGTDISVNAIALDTSNQTLYVGGNFTKVYDSSNNGQSANYIAQWNLKTQRWLPLGLTSTQNGTGALVYALAMDVSNQQLFVGGNFTTVNDASLSSQASLYLANWNVKTSRWSGLGTYNSTSNGVNAQVNALLLDVSNTAVYVGGTFTQSIDSRGFNIASVGASVWNYSTSSWTPMGIDSSTNQGVNGYVTAFTVDTSKNIYAGGLFSVVRDDTMTTDLSANNTAFWSVPAQAWSIQGTNIQNGLNAQSNAMDHHAATNMLYVGGNFTQVYDSCHNKLNVNYLVKWDLSNNIWVPIGNTLSTQNGTNNIVNAITIDSKYGNVFVGGAFSQVYDNVLMLSNASGGAMFNIANNQWSLFGGGRTSTSNGLNNSVYSIYADPSNQMVYVGGGFTKASDFNSSDMSINNVAAYNLQTKRWSGMGWYGTNGTNGAINAYAYDSSKNVVYCGGSFSIVYDSSNIQTAANNIAVWNVAGKYWSLLGNTLNNGLDASCNALIMDSSNQILYVGGNFTNAFDATNLLVENANYIAAWNVSQQKWNRFGGKLTNGLNSYCVALEFDAANNRVFAGGNFTFVSDAVNYRQSANYIAYWSVNSQQWSPLGAVVNSNTTYKSGNIVYNGLSNICRSLKYSNGLLYVGGDFTLGRDLRLYDISLNYIAIWNTTTSRWSGLGGHSQNGTNGNILSYAYDSCKNVVYCGGNFSEVYDLSNIILPNTKNIAAWNINSQIWSRLGSYVDNGTDGSCNAMAMDSSNQVLYVGGSFLNVWDSSNGDTSANYIAKWNVGTQTWGNVTSSSQLYGDGLDGSCNAMVYDTSNSNLYVGGTFSYSNYGPLYYVDVSAIAGFTFEPSTVSGTTVSNVIPGSSIGSATLVGNAVVDSSSVKFGTQVLNLTANQTSYLTLPTLPSTLTPTVVGSGFSVSFWINNTYSSVNINLGYLQIADSTNTNYFMVVTPGGSSADLAPIISSNGSSKTHIVGSISQNTWSHVVFTIEYNGGSGASASNFKTYVNGSNVNSSTSYYPATTSSYSNNSVGRASIYSSTSMISLFDEFYVYGNVLTAAQAKSIYNEGIGVATATSSVYSRNIAKYNVPSTLWTSFGGSTQYTNGVNAKVTALAYDASNSVVYVGGNFKLANDSSGIDISANSIAAWNEKTSKWTNLGSMFTYNGTDGTVSAYAYDSCKNVVYCGGKFANVYDSSNTAGLQTNNIASWNISTKTWSQLGAVGTNNGTDASVNTLTIDTSNQILYVGGNFLNVWDSSFGDQSANYIAAWNAGKSTWSVFGTTTNRKNGTDASVNALALDFSNQSLYVGGAFKNVRDSSFLDQSANFIAKWNVGLQTWSPLGGSTTATNGTSGFVNTLVYDTSNTRLYVGGNFTTAKDSRSLDLSTNYIAAWNPTTSQWSGFGGIAKNGTSGTISAYAYDSCKNVVYCGGKFSLVFDTSNIAGLYANNIAAWSVTTQTWSQLGATGANNGTDASVNTLSMDTSNQILYVGGNFLNVWDSSFGDQSANYIAAWNAGKSTWSVFGTTTNRKNGTDASVNALALDFSNQSLYVGGAFKNVRYSSLDQSANFIAKWNIGLQTWSIVGGSTAATNGTNGFVNTLLYDASNTKLYVGGNFTGARDSRSSGLSTNYIAIWNPSNNQWSGMGEIKPNGTNGTVSCYTYDSCKNIIYCGGSFTYVYDTSNIAGLYANNIAAWSVTTQTWSQLGATGNGTDASVNTLTIDSSNQILYMGGNFLNVWDSSYGDQSANYIAAWNAGKSTWSVFGTTTNRKNGTDASVNALALDFSNQSLYVGGAFKTVRYSSLDQSANFIAKWNVGLQTWSPLGGSTTATNGTGGFVNTLVYDTSNTRLYVGGNFTLSKDSRSVDISTNYMAIWDPSTSQWSGMGSTIFKQDGTNGTISCYVYDSCKNIIYCGGKFSIAYDASSIQLYANNIASWNVNGKYWTQLGAVGTNNGTDASVNTLSMDTSNQILYVGGKFLNVWDSSYGDQSANYIAAWNAGKNVWSVLGTTVSSKNGTNSSVNALALDFSNQSLYVGGNFTSVSDTTQTLSSTNRIANWNIGLQTWSRLGSSTTTSNGTSGDVNTLVYDNSNIKLYVGGNFTTVYDARVQSITSNYVSTWNPLNSRWSVLGDNMPSPADNQITSSVYDSCKNILYCSGYYSTVYDASNLGGLPGKSGVMAWNFTGSYWTYLDFSGTGMSTNATNKDNRYAWSMVMDSSNQILYVGGIFNQVTDKNGTKSANYVAAWNVNTKTWSTVGTLGTSSTVYALALDYPNQQLYVAGEFTSVDSASLSAGYIVRWDITTQTWTRLGSAAKNGTSGNVYAMVYDVNSKLLYVGGNFTIVYDSTQTISTNRVAVWNTTTSVWSRLGTTSNGVNSNVQSMCLDSSNQKLYVGGYFTATSDGTNSSQSANLIAQWSITSSKWSPLGTTTYNGFDSNGSPVYCILLDSSNNYIYACGWNATTSDATNTSQSAKYVAQFNNNTNTWSPLGTSSSNGASNVCYSLFLKDKILYVLGGASSYYDRLGTHTNKKYFAGWNQSIERWVKINKSQHTSLSGQNINGLSSYPNTMALDSSNQLLYVGGNFTTVSDSSNNGQSANYIAQWSLNTLGWLPLGATTTQNGTSGVVNSVVVDSSNNYLYVGGNFTTTSDATTSSQTSNYIAYWNQINSTWSRLGSSTSNGTNNIVSAVVLDGSRNMYIGGNMTTVSDANTTSTTVKNAAVWNPSNAIWSTLGAVIQNGLNSYANTMVLDSCNQILYVGGNFTRVSDTFNAVQVALYIAQWNLNTQNWLPLGATSTQNGTNGVVNSITLDSSNNYIYAGGNFTTVSDATTSSQTANYIAFWNQTSSTWSRLGSSASYGTNNIVSAIVLDGSRNMYIGGKMTTVSDAKTTSKSVNYAAFWTPSTSTWSRLGSVTQNGLNSYANTMALDSCNQLLYVGGNFTTVNDTSNSGQSANYIAQWNLKTERWLPLGATSTQNGTSGYINSITLDSSNNYVYAGGNFTTVGDATTSSQTANYIAFWNQTSSTWSRLGSSSSYGTNNIVSAIVLDGSRNMYIGGNMTTVSDASSSSKTVNNAAFWTPSTSTWSRLGSVIQNGLNSYANTMALDSCNQLLYVGGNFTTVSDTSNSGQSANYIAQWNLNTQNWLPLGATSTQNGTNAYINSIVLDSSNNYVYAGGNFTTVGDATTSSQTANYIAFWNQTSSTWSRLGSSSSYGTNNIVSAIVLDGSRNMYIGGKMTTVSDASSSSKTVKNAAFWTPSTSTWSRLGSVIQNGLNSFANTMALDSSNQLLYVGGSFTTVSDSSNSGQSANYIAQWNLNTQNWLPLGATSTQNGTNAFGYVNSIVLDSSNNYVYAGGSFLTVSDATTSSQNAYYIAFWNQNTSTWSRLGSSSSYGTNNTVSAIVLDGSRNMYIGGNTTLVSDAKTSYKTANYAAFWTPSTSTWSRLGSVIQNGLNSYANTMALDSSNQLLYVGGNFTTVSDSSNSGQSANYIAQWNLNTQNWLPLGATSTQNGTNAYINSIVLDSSNNYVYAGGNFTTVGDATTSSQTANYIAFWNQTSSTWSRLGSSSSYGTNNIVSAIVLDGSRNMYIGGIMTTVSDAKTTSKTVKNAAFWTPSTSTWSRLGSVIQNGLNSYANTMALDSSNQLLYVGGNFTTVSDSSNSGQSAKYIAQWNLNTQNWLPLGATSTQNGTNAYINSIVLDSSNNYVYAGGNFTTVGDATTSSQTANYIAFWNQTSSTWSRLGSSASYGTNNIVSAIVLDGSRNMYIGGKMTTVSDANTTSKTVKNAAFWTPSTSTWSRLGTVIQNGLNSYANTIALDSCNQLLYVGGNFTTVSDSSNNGQNANYLAQWNSNTQRWSPLGTTSTNFNGTNGIVYALSFDASNSTLYAGGNFTIAKSRTGYDVSANYIASWDTKYQLWSPFGYAVGTVNNGVNGIVYAVTTTNTNQAYVGGKFTTAYDYKGTISNTFNNAIWNIGSYRWTRVGGYKIPGLNSAANALIFDPSFVNLYAGGAFSTAVYGIDNSYNVSNAAILNTTTATWSAFGNFNQNGLNFYPSVFAMDTTNNILYAGGNFTVAQDGTNSYLNAPYIVSYNTAKNQWVQLETPIWNGVNAQVLAMTIDTSQNVLYVSGNFTRTFDSSNGGFYSNYIASFNLTTRKWGQLGNTSSNGANATVRAVSYDSTNYRIYAGGDFRDVYDSSNLDLSTNYIASWNTTTQRWSRFGSSAYNGVDGSVNLLQFNSNNNYLLTMGNFNNVNDSTTTTKYYYPDFASFHF